jgi:hypothetical protein
MHACGFHNKYVPQRRDEKILLPALWTLETKPILLKRNLALHYRPGTKMPRKEGIVRYRTFPNFVLMIICSA